MISFIISLIIPIMLAIATFFFSYKTFKTAGNKNGIFNFLAAICTLVLTIYFGINIKPPAPVILPLDNEARIYSDNAEITIESNGFDVYYSLDGSDPQNGIKYENPIIINCSTTVSAKSKFLWKWSEPSQRAYRFETIPITYSNNTVNDRLWISTDEFLNFVFISFWIIVIIIGVLRNIIKNVKNGIRNFFDF